MLGKRARMTGRAASKLVLRNETRVSSGEETEMGGRSAGAGVCG